MDTQRSAVDVATQLAGVRSQQRLLTEDILDVRAELAASELKHGEMYADGEDKSAILEHGKYQLSLATKCAGMASALQILEERQRALSDELDAARGREAGKIEQMAVVAAQHAAAKMAGFVDKLLEVGGPYEPYEEELRDAITSAQRAGMTASALHAPSGHPALRLTDLWNPYPGLLPLLEAIEAYRKPMIAADYIANTSRES